MDFFSNVSGIEPLVEEFVIFRFKISFLTSFRVTVSKPTSLTLISGNDTY